MKFGVIYRKTFHRSSSVVVDSDSREAIKMDLDPKSVTVEQLIDFEGQRIIPVFLNSEGRLIEVPEGDFGEATPPEYFEDQAAEEEKEVEEIQE